MYYKNALEEKKSFNITLGFLSLKLFKPHLYKILLVLP